MNNKIPQEIETDILIKSGERLKDILVGIFDVNSRDLNLMLPKILIDVVRDIAISLAFKEAKKQTKEEVLKLIDELKKRISKLNRIEDLELGYIEELKTQIKNGGNE